MNYFERMLTKIVFQRKLAIVLLAILALSYTAMGDTCPSELTYPLMYGPGDSEVFLMDMKMDATENILLGGLSKSIQTNVGEGYVMLVNKFGKALFSKTYASGASAGDIVNKVAIVGDTYIAVGTSDTGSNAFFLLAYDASGTEIKNLHIATDTGKIPNTASITQMYMQGTEAHVVFDNSVVNIVDTTGVADDRYVGISGESGNIIRIVAHANHTKYSMFAVIDGRIGVYWYDTINTDDNKNVATDTAVNVDPTHALQSSDVDNDLNPSGCWVAVYNSAGNNYHAFHYDIGGDDRFPTNTGAIIANLPYPPKSLSIVYTDSTGYYLSAMLTNQQGSIYKVNGAVQSNKRVSLGLHDTYFMAATAGSVIVTAGNKVKGESTSLESSQAIIFKSDLALNIAGYNCYAISTADTTTVAVYFVVAGREDNIQKNYVTGTSAQTTGSTTAADSEDIPVRSEATKLDAGGVPCRLQKPTFDFEDQTYSTSAADTEHLKDMVTHCQGARMVFTPTVAAYSVPWAVGGFDTFTIKPSSATNVSCCDFGNTLSVNAYAQNSVPNIGTDLLDITFTE
jgi:hypothetical protein